MDVTKANSKKNPNYKENKFIEEEAVMHADKAAERSASLNQIPKQSNRQ
ncbi:hypothetical protein [Paenibacillus radicis (ex Xue et al. 2023)]|uniref:YfhD family protein n=1 Tax=Paenibacillus radicis (ex Xue et al. 2023) TaxID=2972489 RepID=A0ABT1YEX8_9BACL|nr:hypothetical protein [Paenibacillus radicis (ex Xue et al. 2023)]MCR8631756.1 hypothetical protein [Paenibacillus radicis (ex Xue et al. 2023)]